MLERKSTQLNSTQVYRQKVAGWLKEIQYIKTNQMIKVNEIKKKTIKRSAQR